MAAPTCEKGHAMTPENSLVSLRTGKKTPRAQCRECNRIGSRARRERRAAEQGKTVRVANLVVLKSGRQIDLNAYESHVNRGARADDCWLWTGPKHDGGYGTVGGRGGAHRVAYEMENGAIPEGLEVDHLCFVPSCVNPAHLEAVTHEENVRRRVVRQTHCKHGHEFTPENIIRQGVSGRARRCRTCHNACMRRRRALKASPRTVESWTPEAELTPVTVAGMAS